MKMLYLISVCLGIAYCINHREVQETLNAEMQKEHINEQDQLLFKNWMLEYGKSYDNDFTAIHRMNIFMKNKKSVDKHNSMGLRYKSKLNEFSDFDYDELAYRMFMHIDINDDLPPSAETLFFGKSDVKQLKHNPILAEMREQAKKGDGLDWSKKVPGPKPQGTCGSCWAFSSSDVFISRLVVKGKEDLVQLSKTHLIDCCVGDKNKGCNGGSPVNAYKFMNDNGALKDTEYRDYDGKQQECTSPEGHIGKGEFADYQKLDDPSFEYKYFQLRDIKNALQDGPIVALMYADKSWFDYSNGIIDTCGYVGQKENSHAVVFVGYTADYYIVKNSWGTGWGEGGFFKVQRNGPSECLDKIKRISYPVVA